MTKEKKVVIDCDDCEGRGNIGRPVGRLTEDEASALDCGTCGGTGNAPCVECHDDATLERTDLDGVKRPYCAKCEKVQP